MHQIVNKIDRLWGVESLMRLIPKAADIKLNRGLNDSYTNYTFRLEYIKRYGYVLITQEFLRELDQVFTKHNIHKFIELGAGTGFITKVLTDLKYKCYGITLEIEENHWGLSRSPMYEYCLNKRLLTLGDLNNIIIEHLPELAISSWIPYEGGEETINFFKNNGLPEYYLLIGEGPYGCTSSDEFFDFVNSYFEEIYTFQDYTSFDLIRDNAILYKKKGR